jgi:hypothetical protein
MRSTHFRNWIACGMVIGLWGVAHLYAGAEAQSATQDEASKSSNHAPAAEPAPPPPIQSASAVSAARSSVSLSPAVAMVKCKLGESYSQTLTVTNQTGQELVFEMVAEDVVVRDGKRMFVPAGETPEGIAATAVFTQKEVVVKPGQSSSVGVTFTVPPETPLRAAVAAFRGSTKISNGGAIKMTASLGTLFSFTVSENSRVETAALAVTAQSATANLGISQILTNTGSEPVVVDGVAAVLDQAGAMVGKAAFEPERLLPGERVPFRTDYPAELKTGRYRVLASFQYGENVITSSSDFTVP